MKEAEVVTGAIDTIVDALAGIHGVGTNGESYFYEPGEDSDYFVTYENGEIIIPTKFNNKKDHRRLCITLKVGFDYI